MNAVRYIVPFLAIGIGLWAFGAMGLIAILKWRVTGSIAYAIIWLIALAILSAFSYQMYKLYTLPDRIQQEIEADRIIRRLRGVDYTRGVWPGPS